MALLRATLPVVALAAIASAAAPADRADPPRDRATYVGIAARYRAGDREGAIVLLRRWRLTEIERAVAALRRTPPVEVEFRTVEAAALMHAHLAFIALGDEDASEATTHVDSALAVLEWTHQPAARGHAGPGLQPRIDRPAFHAALAAGCLGFWSVQLADEIATRGLRLAPRDPQLLYVAGCAKEGIALRAALDRRGDDAGIARRAAQSLFREVLAATPGNADAAVRLGHVLLEDGHPSEAQRVLEPLATGAPDAVQRYLAALFLGRLHERRSSWSAARDAYSRALRDQPDSQAARLGLAALLEQESGPAAARPLVLASLALSRQRGRADDPWWYYPFGPHRLAGEVLEELQRKVAGP